MSEDHHAGHSTIEPEKADPTAAPTFVVGGVSVFLLIAIVFALQALFHRTMDAEHQRKVISQQPHELRLVQTEQLEQLTAYRWVNESEGIVAIPIDNAMELTVREQGDR